MTNVEISIIVIAILIPIVALVIFLPKKLRKDKSKVNDIIKTESEPQAPVDLKLDGLPTIEESKAEDNIRESFNFTEVNENDFKDYLMEKKNNTDKPERKYPDFDGGVFDDDLFDDLTFGESRRKRKSSQDSKSIKEQINDLSPELKVLLLAGVLDKKDY